MNHFQPPFPWHVTFTFCHYCHALILPFLVKPVVCQVKCIVDHIIRQLIDGASYLKSLCWCFKLRTNQIIQNKNFFAVICRWHYIDLDNKMKIYFETGTRGFVDWSRKRLVDSNDGKEFRLFYLTIQITMVLLIDNGWACSWWKIF